MSRYRDDLRAARLRTAALEEELDEHEAQLAAQDEHIATLKEQLADRDDQLARADHGPLAVDETKRGMLAALWAGGRLAADGRSGELCEHRVTLGLIRRQQLKLVCSLDDPSAGKQAEHPAADGEKHLSHVHGGEGRDALFAH